MTRFPITQLKDSPVARINQHQIVQHVEQEIWNDFKNLSESNSNKRLSFYERNDLITVGINKKLEYDEDYRINKFLSSADHNNINWKELEKLYPVHQKIELPNERIYKPAKFRTHRERVDIDLILLNDWENKKIKLYHKIPNEQAAQEYLVEMRWKNEFPESPFDINSKVYYCAGGKYKCKNSGKYFNVRTNTIFDNTKLPLLKWFECMYLLTSIKTSKISTHQLSRGLLITQKTAWGMANKIQSKIEDDFLINIKLNLFK